MADKQIDTEKYQGPGRVTAAFGDAKLWAIGGSVAGAGVGAGAASLPKPDGKVGKFIQKMASFLEGNGQSAIRSAVGEAKTSKGMLALAGAVVGSAVLGTAGLVVGFFHGWRKGNRGEEQFNAIKAERNEALQTIAAMQTQMVGLQSEVETHRKKFTESVTSRAEHGGHAAAAHHEKEHNQQTEATR